MQSRNKMIKSSSDTKTFLKKDIIKASTPKQRSTGSLKTNITTTSTTKNNNNKTKQQKNTEKPLIWRSPGHCEIPDILGKAYLQPISLPTKPVVKKTMKPANIKPPWYPVSYNNWSQNPFPPIVSTRENPFEKRLRKAIPSITLISQPKSRYIGNKEIGTGVNGSVIQVNIRGSTAQLALKRCKLDNDREYRAAIVRELRIMSTGHKNLIKLKEAAVYKNDIWMAMDLMRCSVFTVLCCRGLPEKYSIYIVREVLNALSFLHNKGFIHRDVKCENLLISHQGEVKLADFGLATSTKYENRERLGTAKWMAPEVIKEIPYDEKIDLWSLGITLIEMQDRVPPLYDLKDEDEVFEKILDQHAPSFIYSYPSIYCTGLVAWLLEESPKNRPTAKDVIMEIDTHIEQGLLKSSNAKELSSFINKTL
ncbi:kinase-like domain-containing protein [Cunninghamella echinulata]|nr:kinase-like domain-containing protein [Cunninghamella echinulata]